MELALPDGGTRTIAWKNGQGTVDVTDRFANGSTSQTTLHSGDVVPLLPGTLDDRPYTPDKAVTVDLDFGHGEGYPLWIYPQRNEAIAGDPPVCQKSTGSSRWKSPARTRAMRPAMALAV